jgi:hypothetical protein
MGAAILPVIQAVAGLTTAAAGIQSLTQKPPAVSVPAVPPATGEPKPKITDVKKGIETAEATAAETARKEERKRRRQKTRTLLTGPRGILTEAPTERKTLLGQ